MILQILGGIAVLIFGSYLWFQYMKGVNKYFPNLDEKVVIVTGGNSGLGKETARLFHQLKATVIITGRSQAKADSFMATLGKGDGFKEMQFYSVDLSDLNQIARFADIIKAKYNRLDILVNNAGGGFGTYRLTKQGLEASMGCNHLAHVYLVSLLLPLLKNAGRSRVVNVASIGHTWFAKDFKKYIDDKDIWMNKPGVDYAKDYKMMSIYGFSKYANVVFAKGLQQHADKLGIEMRSVSLHPGGVDTNFPRFMAKKHPILWTFFSPIWRLINILYFKTEAEGAACSLHCSLAPFEKIEKGEYYMDCRATKTDPLVTQQNVDYFWDDSVRQLKELMNHDAFTL